MEIIRRFKKMSLWDFIDLMNEQCLNCGDRETYFLYLDEIKLRRIESVSEGGDHKLRSLAKELLHNYEEEMKKSSDFSNSEDYQSFKFIVENEI